MADTLIFCYGLELNFSLLHCTIGGPRPLSFGTGHVPGLQHCWDASGHLPNVRPVAGAVLHGAIVHLLPEQLQRLQSARLTPLLYQWRKTAVVLPTGLRRRAQLLWCPKGRPPGRPNLQVWQEVVLGALEQGLPDRAIEELLAVRPNDRLAVLQRWGAPWPARGRATGLRLAASGGLDAA